MVQIIFFLENFFFYILKLILFMEVSLYLKVLRAYVLASLLSAAVELLILLPLL